MIFDEDFGTCPEKHISELRERTGPYEKVKDFSNGELYVISQEMAIIRGKRGEWKESWIREQLSLRRNIIEKFDELLDLYNQLDD